MPLFGWKRADKTRRFRKAYCEIPKKNGKSTLASGIGLYLLAGDGEPGAEVYSAASDVQQASIVHGEAVNMVDASAPLSQVLKINRTSKTITYESKKSYYRALSAEAHSKEGLNAHGIIADELHVWYARKLWDALKYAFRARRQGLLFVITTAGDDMQSICREQHDYATGVIRGDIKDDRFFGYIRAADLEDNWLEEKTWYKANPSLGITIKKDEFAADVLEAQKTPTAQSTFKRYSLNIWATSTNPWLRIESWLACGQEFTEADMLGRRCWGGLDLASVSDMTAFVLVFPWDDGFRLLPYFWLPQARIDDNDSPEQYRVWAQQKLLFTTPGATTDHNFTSDKIAELSKKFDIVDFAFDKYNAEQLTWGLEQNHGIKRFEFGQTIQNFASPTADFERLILAGHMWHNNNPIMNWQIGHVQVWQDNNGNKRPVKPKHGDKRKIDGVVGAIMGLARARQNPEPEYDGRMMVIG